MRTTHRAGLAALPFLAAAALALGGTAHAQPAGGTAPSASAPAELADGEVRKVDKDSGRITLKHGPIRNLEMPGMTMAFQVKEPAMLESVQAGDRVRFLAEKVSGKLMVVRLEPAR